MPNKNNEAFVKEFHAFMNRIETVFDVILENKVSKENKQAFALCLTEIYFDSLKTIALIDKMSKTNLNSSGKELDNCFRDIIDLKINLYDEMASWMKNLRVPLQNVLDEFPEFPVTSDEK